MTYVVRRATRQPRINKSGLTHFDGIVETNVFFCDVDNQGHAEWNDQLTEVALQEYQSLPVLATAGVYHTAHGRRIVQPIAEPVPVSEVERFLRRWLVQLEAAGLPVDWACRDWTRHFRLPHLRRAGHDYRSPFVSLERMTPIALNPIAAPKADPAVLARLESPLPPAVPAIAWTAEAPELWHPRVERIAAAVRDTDGNWHELFLALAGALIARGAPPEHVPALARAISVATGADTRVDDREQAARTTVQRHLAGQAVTGYSTLRRRWPTVAAAVDVALATGMQARIRAQIEEEADLPTCSLEEISAALEDAIRRAPEGLTLIKAECGLGKTAAIRRIAKERADKPYVSPKATGKRVPNQSKTSISVDKNALAIQVTEDLRAIGASVRRLFGPLSVLRDDGTPECRLYDNALPLVQGGQSIQREFCQGRGKEKCEHYETCLARDGEEGPEKARILVGPHALLAALNGEAGITGLLVIDEPPTLLESSELAVADFDAALRSLDRFDLRYGHAMRPSLRALRAWTESVAPVGEVTGPLVALRATVEHVGPAELRIACNAANVEGLEGAETIVECVRGALPKDYRGSAPTIERVNVFAARRVLDLAKELGAASRVLRMVYDVVLSEEPVALRVEAREGSRYLAITKMREDLVRAVRRQGAVVVADANVELHAPLLAKVVGYDPRMHTFSAPDGAPILRTLFHSWSATRKKWLPGGKLAVDSGIAKALSTVLAWAAEDPRTRDLALVTFLPLAIALRATLEPGNASFEQAWKDAEQRPEDLPRAREVLGPVLAGWTGRIVVGHYGGLRGLDHMKDLDALATLGDPWPNLGEVKHDIAFLGVTEAWEARVEAMCRAELEQAHGRLRTVHRTRPGRALHVGRVLPSGSGWKGGGVELRGNGRGRPKNTATMRAEEVLVIVTKVGGVGVTAQLIGCSRRTMTRYLDGDRSVPQAVSSKLRALTVDDHAAA